MVHFCSETLPKPSENQSKIDARGLLEPILGSLGQHLGHISPEDWILEAFGMVLEAQNVQLGSNMEAPDPLKSRPKPEKIDVKKQHVFAIDFKRVRTSFWKNF